jgi:prepilin-type N-terminal cleavage/methylation domain-containing protein
MNFHMRRRCKVLNSGFTLVELMMAAAVMALFMVGTTTLLIQSLRLYYYDSARIQINRDTRVLTQQAMIDADGASYIQVYQDFINRNLVASGLSGDFMVLIFLSDPDPTTGKQSINQVTGYYRDTPGAASAVHRFSVQLSSAANGLINYDTSAPDSATPITTVLSMSNVAPTSSLLTNQIVLPSVQGLASGALFYNISPGYNSSNVIIQGQIIEQGVITSKAVNTYNFTISARSSS